MFFPRQWRVEDFLTPVMTSCHDQLPLRKGIDAMNRILVRGVPPPKESKGPALVSGSSPRLLEINFLRFAGFLHTPFMKEVTCCV